MDIRTGRTYETREAALAAGVPEADLALLTGPAEAPEPKFTRLAPLVAENPRHPHRHQSSREQQRRQRQLAKGGR